MNKQEPELYGIKDATDLIDTLDFGDIDILNEYLNNERWAADYLKPSEEYKDPENQKQFFPAIAGFLNSNHWGRESIKHYALYASRKILSERE